MGARESVVQCAEGKPNVSLGIRYSPHHQIFKDATLFFSRAIPNLATVIPAMDHIDERLATDVLNEDFDPAIRVALGLAKKTLNRYYEMTDDSFLYRTATSKLMHAVY